MTKPAWIKLEKIVDFIISLSPHNRQRGIDVLKDFVASELQAVLGGEKKIDKRHSVVPRRYPQGYNAHYQECLKRSKERVIIK